MNYLTAKEVAKNWKISDRRVLQYCNEKRIEGAIKIGNIWIIPKNTKKPTDMRKKSSHQLED